jgi:predicted MFS family arabinose efflux permease
MALGAVIGGKVLQHGRWNNLVVFNVFGLVASILSVISNFYIICAGRFLFGMSAGVLIAVAPRMLEETVPHDIYDSGFGASINTAIDVVILINLLLSKYMT